MEDQPNARVILPAIVLSVVLFIAVYFAYQSAKMRPGTIVLPGGITYLGPTPSPTTAPTNVLTSDGKIPVSSDVTWSQEKGKIYPYTFSYPSSLSLGVFPNDPYDAVTIFFPGTDSNTNIFFRVEDLTKLNKSQYIGKPKEYVNTWWKEYTWKGVSSVMDVTNGMGLHGYRATYVDDKNQPSSENVFLTVPNHPDLMIWVSSKLFSPEIFNKIVDSVAWGK